MREENVLEMVRKIIAQEVGERGYHLECLILFGSRARGDATPDSDWDFLAVLDKPIGSKVRGDISMAIRRKLSRLRIPNDILILSREELERERDDVGRVTYYVLREGKIL